MRIDPAEFAAARAIDGRLYRLSNMAALGLKARRTVRV
jgi:hypothetical protein